MKPLFLALVFFAAFPLLANVVRPAPDFAWIGAGGENRSFKSLRGQPVVLLVAPSSRSGAFRAQVDRIEELYRILSSRRVLFVAAFTGDDRPVRSDVPFVLAASGPAVAQAFGVQDRFSVIVIGPDGNIDLQSGDVVPGERIRDVIANSFERQKSNRKAQ